MPSWSDYYGGQPSSQQPFVLPGRLAYAGQPMPKRNTQPSMPQQGMPRYVPYGQQQFPQRMPYYGGVEPQAPSNEMQRPPYVSTIRNRRGRRPWQQPHQLPIGGYGYPEQQYQYTPNVLY